MFSYAGVGDEAGPGLDVQITALDRLGWPGVELRTVDGVALADLDEAAFGRVAGRLAHAGLSTVCVDSRIANWGRPITAPFEADVAELEALVPRCAALGTRYVRVMSYPNDGLDEPDWRREVLRRMRALSERAEDAGLVLLHENCSGWAGTSAERMLTLLRETGSPALRLVFDTGNGVPYGYSAYEVLSQVVDHVAHVQIKDATGDQAASIYTFPGEGRARVADCLRLLVATGYRGVLSIEPHLTVRPHEHRLDAGDDGIGTFVAYGRALERLVADAVLGSGSEVMAGKGGRPEPSGPSRRRPPPCCLPPTVTCSSTCCARPRWDCWRNPAARQGCGRRRKPTPRPPPRWASRPSCTGRPTRPSWNCPPCPSRCAKRRRNSRASWTCSRAWCCASAPRCPPSGR
jgi:sugar phosphate isomerase/epimerase